MGKMLKALQKAKDQQKAKSIEKNNESTTDSLRTKKNIVLNGKIETDQNQIETKMILSELKHQKDEELLNKDRIKGRQFFIDSNQPEGNHDLSQIMAYGDNSQKKYSSLIGDKDKIQDNLNYSRIACGAGISKEGKFDIHSSKIKKRNTLFTLYKPNSVMSEYFKVIRTIFLSMTSKHKIKTILVTSLLPREGKTFISSNLAVSIALSFDKYVLLIDADLKKPSLQKFFAINADKGLTDFFMDQTQKLPCLIQKTEIPKLSILASGSACENTSELVSSETMSNLIHELKHRYNDRYIIFDSAPLQMSDTLSLASKVDGVLIVVKVGKTSKKIVKQAIYKIGKEKILGVVLNYCKVDLKKNYYYSKKKVSRM